MIDQILDHCEGVIGIADDIIIHGKDDAEHDRRLYKFMKVAREHGLVLNKKCEVKSNSVKFLGCVYDKHGAHPDPSKVSAIKEMPAPQNKGELQSFLRMVTYLSPFILQVSSHTATLRGLLKTVGLLSLFFTPTANAKSWAVEAFSLCVLLLPYLQEVPHGTKGTGPKFVTSPVYLRSQLRNNTNTVLL